VNFIQRKKKKRTVGLARPTGHKADLEPFIYLFIIIKKNVKLRENLEFYKRKSEV
jgi:hypothetical protein